MILFKEKNKCSDYCLVEHQYKETFKKLKKYLYTNSKDNDKLYYGIKGQKWNRIG